MIEPALKCSAPECSQFGVYLFRRRSAGGGEVVRRACADHRARGEAWFAAGLDAAASPAPPPVQGSLL